jgi:F-type H+-transporting ATPase subunit delta
VSHKISRRVLARTIASKLIAEPQRRDHWVKALAAYIVQYNQIGQTEMILRDIAHELLVQNGTLLVDVASARPLSDDIRTQLAAYLRQTTGARLVDMHEHVEPALIGGFIARTPDYEIDASVQGQLRQLSNIA